MNYKEFVKQKRQIMFQEFEAKLKEERELILQAIESKKNCNVYVKKRLQKKG